MTDEEHKVDALVERLETVSSPIRERWSRDRIGGFGLCTRCTHFFYQRTQFNNESAKCFYYGRRERECYRNDPIIECSGFYPIGQMDLRDMVILATIIDPGKKGRIGF